MMIVNKFATSKCRQCGKRNAVGESVYYQRGVRGVLCGVCKPQEGPRSEERAPRTVSDRPVTLPADTGNGNHVVREFASWAHYVDTAANCRATNASHRAGFVGDSWSNTADFNSAIELAREGWTEVRDDVETLVSDLDAQILPTLSPAFTSYFDVSGGMVDVGRYLDGEPECMVETKLVEIAKPGRVISILVNGGFRSGVRASDIQERGVAIVGLVESLERMQHSTEIWLEVSSQYDNKPALTHLVPLKRASERLDIDALMFAIAHPARHRRLSFAIRANEEGQGRKFGFAPHDGRIGMSVPNMCTERVGATINLDQLRLGMSAKQWVKKQLIDVGLIKGEE